ncbi:MAG: hypothetical protein E7162_00450 [Firmicutes bacterium]|nr:hypothetical protein [Bacillota bacterium]
MSLIDLLDNNIYLDKFIIHKTKNTFSKKEIKDYQKLKDDQNVKQIIKKIQNNNYVFSIPKKTIINKIKKNKKRIVYQYNKEETYILKYLTFLLYKYDYLFTPNLYSFRQNKSVKNAINDLIKIKPNQKYGYKLDIENYFNSVDTKILLKDLKKDLDDQKLYKLFKLLLENKQIIYKDEIINEEKGIMAGVPISSFLANYYLKDMDKYFYDNNINYFRYADDIIIFSDNQDNLNKYITIIKEFLNTKKLNINKEKEIFYLPNNKIEYLGFSIQSNEIDISSNSLTKIKKKIKRSSKSIRRWMLKKNVKQESAIKTMTKKFNKKFFGKEENELSWKYWYFPTINTDKSLKIIDEYMQQELRYLITGKHNKKNYEKVPYELLKKCNYKSLINEYYKDKKKK